jgi:O-antigen/teichoic acid export membrane protein
MRRDAAIIALLFLLPLILFWPQTVGGKTLLPAENLYQWEPYYTYRAEAGVPEQPHNHLLSDLVLQNMQWKALMRDELARGEFPLWNPHQFGGIPFHAAGQQQVIYPLSVLFYALPLAASYGWFTVVNLWLAGVFMYWFVRALGVGRFGAAIAGITYQLCGMFAASALFPMIIGASVWLPLILQMCEYVLRRQTWRGIEATPAWVSIGAAALACSVLSGHAELMIYTLLIAGYYSAVRLLGLWWAERRVPVGRAIWLIGMVGLGLALSMAQLVPLLEHVQTNWRAERSSFETVLGYAHPPRDVVQYLLPNFYGSPAHHGYWDVLGGWQWVDAPLNAEGRRVIDWGIKNYVEAALYVGILPLILSVFALVTAGRDRTRWTFAGLGVLSASFMFGLPTYALIYVLPGINQLNSPFRWVYGVTVAVCVLAGFGADALHRHRGLARYFGWAMIGTGGMQLIGLVAAYATFELWSPLAQAVLRDVERWADAFSDVRMFFGYLAPQVLTLALVLVGGGVAVLACHADEARVRWGQVLAVLVLAADLLAASWGFNAASEPAWLDYTPPAVAYLQAQAGDDALWRYTVINAPDQRELLQANMTMRYGLDDVRGYDSIISRQYVDYVRGIETASQPQLDFNRIAPLYTWDDYQATLNSPRFKKLNVRFVVTHRTTTVTAEGWGLVYEDEAVRIWEDAAYLPRAYALQDPSDINRTPDEVLAVVPADTTRLNAREYLSTVETAAETWLILSETYAAGWKAFVRPVDGGEVDETPLEVARAFDNFIGARVPAGAWVVRWIYSPSSFQVGVFGSVIGAALTVLCFGIWAWRALFARGEPDASGRLMRNTLAPILLNLFNRGVDFAFASVLFRLLGPDGAGLYYYAIVVFGWFDIFTNFGLDVYLMREAARLRNRAGALFANTTGFRLVLVVAGVPLLMGFVFARQALGGDLDPLVLWTLALFYVGLVPGSLSKGLTSLYYAFDRAEYPAVVTTLTTISKVTGGLIALLMGWGIVGLAAVSIVTNIVTLVILLWGARGMLGGLRSARPQTSEIGQMARGSWPLMLNHFLATIFFQIDIVLLEVMKGERVVGLYRVAYSWLLAINVVPAFFTQALMATLSRQAHDDKAAFARTYRLGIKLLVCVALPFAVLFSLLAEPLTLLLAGTAYLPDGAIALQIMVWSIPIGWMNSLTQYALVALDLQRRVTWAFAAACLFNIVANGVFIPQYSYQAAAVTTILSELVLFIPFALLIERGTGMRVAWWRMLWKPYTAAGAMLLLGVALAEVMTVWATAALAGAAYVGVLWRLNPLDAAEWGMIAPALPASIRGRVAQLRAGGGAG